jgi:phosphatidylglycerol:prolipoprotein diacylglycerol transferase
VLPYISVRSFDILGLEFRPFFVLVVLGIIAGVIIYDRICRRGGQIDRQAALHLPEICLIGGIVGAHLMHVLVYHPELMDSDPWVLLKIWGGFSSMGGFLGGTLSGLVYLVAVKRVPVLPYGDRTLTGLTMGWIFGRTGCAVTHDHPGIHSDFFLAVVYPDGARHDLGTYELFLTLAISATLYIMGRKPRRVGDFMMVILLMYAPVRFGLDFLRIRVGDYADTRFAGLTAAQYGMIFLLGVGIWLLATRKRRPLDVAFFGPLPPAARATQPKPTEPDAAPVAPKQAAESRNPEAQP